MRGFLSGKKAGALLEDEGSEGSSESWEDAFADFGASDSKAPASTPSSPGLLARAGALASSVRAAAKETVGRPIGDAKRSAEFAVTASPSALRNKVSGAEDQLGLIDTNAFQEDAARGGDLLASYGDIDRGVVASAKRGAIPTPVSAALTDRRLGAIKSRGDEKGDFEEGTVDRDVLNLYKGTNKSTGVASVSTGLVKKVIGTGVDAGATALAPFTGGASLAVGSGVNAATGKGLDWLSGKAIDAKAEGHGVSLDAQIDMMIRNPMLAHETMGALHGDSKIGAFHQDLAEASPAAAGRMALSTAKGKEAESVKSLGKSAAYAATGGDPFAAFDTLFDPFSE